MESERSTKARPSDEELVRRTCAGQRRAFDELIERYQRRATTVAYRLLGNLHDALEACQEAFIRAYQNLQTLEDQRRFGSWLLRIVTNLSLNFRRARGTGGRVVSFDDCILDGERPRTMQVSAPDYSDERPGAKLAADELSDVLHVAMAELPDRQRLALVLFSIEQMPQRQVAEILDCSVEAVKWHVHQARKKLRERLAEHL